MTCANNYDNFDFYSMVLPPDEFPELHVWPDKKVKKIIVKRKRKIIIKKKVYVKNLEDIDDLNKLKRVQLLTLCKKKGLKKYSKLKKAELILKLKL